MTPPFLIADALNSAGVRHGFFGRAGGVSTGVYASLNVGRGSEDDPAAVTENRRRCAAALGVEEPALVTHYQVHSADVLYLSAAPNGPPRQADAAVTDRPGLALGVLAADCMPWLFCDPHNAIIGAAHAGWRGALAGVLQNTVAAMVRLGADPTAIRAAVGPCLRQRNFEVGGDLVDAFSAKYPDVEEFLAAGDRPDKSLFDLVGFASRRIREAGVGKIEVVGQCTLDDPSSYFSYRGMRQRGEADYGRNLSAIALA